MRTDSRFDPEVVLAVVAVRDRMGWNPTTFEKLPIRLMCAVRELDEFEHALSTPYADWAAKRAQAWELADVSIYLMLMLHDLTGGPVWGWRSFVAGKSKHCAPETLTRTVRKHLTNAFESWRLLEDAHRKQDAQISLELALREVCLIAYSCEIDLDAAIAEKLEVLKTREPRNGGKHPDS